MKTRCTSCGATYSLDVLIELDSARRSFVEILKIDNALAIALIKYLSLFRHPQRDLTFTRVEHLLAQLLPDIRAQRIERNTQVFEAPPEAWAWAMRQAIEARDAGRLKTPLKGHGWLHEVLTNWKPEAVNVVREHGEIKAPATRSQTLEAMAAMEGVKRGS